MSFFTKLSITCSVLLGASMIALPTVAEAKTPTYSSMGGTFYTFTYADAEAPVDLVAPATYLGQIAADGSVTRIGPELGIDQITDADYNPVDGLIYFIGMGYTDACHVWTIDPIHPNTSLIDLGAITRVGYAPSGCYSLVVTSDGAAVAISHGDGNDESSYYLDYFNGDTLAFINSDHGFNPGYNDNFWAADVNSTGHVATLDLRGRHVLWPAASGGKKVVTKMPKHNVTYHSLKFDAHDTEWILRWSWNSSDAIQLGKFNSRSRMTAWGPTLIDASTDANWLSDTLIFVPN